MRALLIALLAALAGLWLGIRTAQGPADPAPVTPAQQTAARAYLDDHLAPLPPGWDWDSFEAAPGIRLETGSAPAVGARRGTIVFVPGYTAPIDMYGDELRRLAEAGWDVAAISYRGQGRSPRFGADGEMGWVDDYATLAADLAAFVRAQAGPVGILANSKGAHVALRMAAQPDAPDLLGLVLIAPMVAIRTEPFPEGVARGISRALTLAGLGDTYALGRGPWDEAALFDDAAALARGTDCARDPARAHLREALFALEPGLRVGGPSTAWVDATFRSQAALAAAVDAVRAPVVMLTAGEDRIVRTEAASMLCRALADCTEIRVDTARHCMIEDGAETRETVLTTALDSFAAMQR